MKAVTEQGYETPTPIQAQAIPQLLDDKDLLGIAQTGTGKTAAFALPTLDYLLDDPINRRSKSTRVLVLAPTRELASQIAESFRSYSKYMDCVVQTVFGGVKIGKQIRAMSKGAHVLVATPGRLLDLMNQGAVTVGDVEVLILDEADQMLDMGFIPDLKRIISKVPKDRQTLLFSATMPKTIADLAQQFLKDPVKVSVAPESTTAERVNQGVIHIAPGDKPALLSALMRQPDIDRALIFTRTKHGADKVVRKLKSDGIAADAIHGNKSQSQRTRALDAFKDGRTPVLVATDIAARGIDIRGITHVVNYEMPNVAEQYVHRIGRTARAGKDGLAISFVAQDELYYLREVEKTIRQDVPVLEVPEGAEVTALPTPDPSFRPRKPKGPSGGRGGQRGGQRSGQGGGGGGRSRGGRPGGQGKSGGGSNSSYRPEKESGSGKRKHSRPGSKARKRHREQADA